MTSTAPRRSQAADSSARGNGRKPAPPAMVAASEDAPKRRARPARKQQIIERAVELIQEKGFLGTSIQDVADQLDFTKAAFYYFVKNKEELLYEIMQQAMNLSLQSMAATAQSDLPPAKKLELMIDGYVRMMSERGDLMSILFQEKRHLSPEHYEAITRTEQHILDAWKEVYRAGVADGSFADIPPTVAAFAMIGVCSWTYLWLNPAGPLPPAEVAAILQQIVLHGVTRPSAGAEAPVAVVKPGAKPRATPKRRAPPA